ncbi:MAG: flippase-like domain-containing protein [Chloroflexota bacterium]|nr:flippase-like domain-containing protein [Chloroflexota bacterium]
MLTNLDNTSESFEDEDENQPENLRKNSVGLLQEEPLTIENTTSSENTTSEITRAQLSLSKRFLNWRTIVPLAVVLAAFFIFVLPHLDIQQTWSTIRHANMYFYVCAFLVYYLTFPLRAFRWKLLLENVGFTKENGVHLPKLWKMVEIVFVSYFVNVIVPAKLGDMYRAYLLRQETGVSATRSFGTVLAERLLDLIVLLLLCIPAVMISLKDKTPPQIQFVLLLMLVAVILSVVALFILHKLSAKIETLVPLRFREQYIHLQEGMTRSFSRRLPLLSLLTLGTWVGEAMRFFFVALALGLFSGSLLHIVAAAFFIGLVEALLTVIPSTGGGLGLVEAGMAGMIVLLNPGTGTTTGSSLAAAAIVLDRSVSLFSIMVIGFVVFMFAFSRQTHKKNRFHQK